MGKFLTGVIVGIALAVWGYSGFPAPDVAELSDRARAAYNTLLPGDEQPQEEEVAPDPFEPEALEESTDEELLPDPVG